MSDAATAAGIALYPAAGGGANLSVGGAVQILTIFGVSLGLRPDFLIAGMLGAVASIFLLNSVPLEGQGFGARLSNMFQRFFVVLSSAATAGYLSPLFAGLLSLNSDWGMATAFLVGAGARILLLASINRLHGKIDPATARKAPPTPAEGA